MNNYLKYSFIFCTILILDSNIFAQKNLFSIRKIGTKYSEQQLIKSLNQADWCGYFHLEQQFELTFDDGAVVDLLPKNEIDATDLNEDCYQSTKIKDEAVFKIHDSGIIIRMVSARNTSKN